MLENGGGDVILTCASAAVSLFLFKYFLIRSEKLSLPNLDAIATDGYGGTQAPNTPGDETTAGKIIRTRKDCPTDSNEVHQCAGDQQRGNLSRRIIGLENLGNTCYVNALLQALSCIPEFYDWIERSSPFVYVPRQTAARRRPPSSAGETPFFEKTPVAPPQARIQLFFHSVRRVLNVLNNRYPIDGTTYAAAELMRVMYSGMDKSVQYSQQDPDELFLFMLNLLAGALAVQLTGLFSSLERLNGNTVVISNASPHVEGVSSSCVATRSMPFQGLFHQDLYCVVCRSYRAQPLEVFYSLSVSLPAPSRAYKKIPALEDLLQTFFTPADLDAVECPTCTGVSANPGQNRPLVRTPHLKRISVAKAPKVLCVHIRRAVWGADDAWKRSDHVLFPSSLTLDRYSWLKHLGVDNTVPFKRTGALDNGIRQGTIFQDIYCLKSVVVHVGQSSVGGHIVAYRKGPVRSSRSDSWFFTSDQTVRSATWSEVELSNPYMLFYERMHPCSDG